MNFWTDSGFKNPNFLLLDDFIAKNLLITFITITLLLLFITGEPRIIVLFLCLYLSKYNFFYSILVQEFFKYVMRAIRGWLELCLYMKLILSRGYWFFCFAVVFESFAIDSAFPRWLRESRNACCVKLLSFSTDLVSVVTERAFASFLQWMPCALRHTRLRRTHSWI